MSKSEKRYFVLDAKKSGRKASRYLALFEAINSMEEYSEDELKRKFRKNLSSDKGYLYESILRSMRDYRSSSSKAAQVKEKLMDARYLYERGLYNQSIGRIREAKVLSKDLVDQFVLLEINKEEQLSLFDRQLNVQIEDLETLKVERSSILMAIDEELRYLDLYYKLLLEVFREFNLKDSGSIEDLKKRLPVHLLDQENKPQSPQAIRRFYLCNAAYFNLIGDLEKVLQFSIKAVEWWDDFPALKEEEFHRYIINVSNLVNTAHKLEKQFALSKYWFEKLKREKSSKSYHNQKVIFLKLSISSILHLMNQNEFEKARKMLPEIINGLNKFGLRKSMVLTGNIVIVYFLVKEYKNCIKWADLIIKNLKRSGREDIQRVIRIIRIIALYEIGNIEKMESGIRATNRYFKSIGLPKDRFEQEVLNNYLRRIFNAPLFELKQAMLDLKNYLIKVKSSANRELPLGVDELLIWVGNKN